MTTAACGLLSVDQLKEKLLSIVENGQSQEVQDCLSELERAPINKDILESTRVGAIVNEVRKKIADKWPDVSKKCRSLIKNWQKLVEVRPPSTASSANGTPNLVSPNIAKLTRRITPGTPVNRRVTSTGLTNGRGLTVSPANGSYAPKELVSPNGAIHKSQSVGTDLLGKGDENRNGKRKSDETVAGGALKRTKTVVGLSSQGSQPGVSHSVSAARMAVQSTSELVAQLSQNLPEHMSIDSSLRLHEEKVKREQQDEELAISLLHGPQIAPSASSSSLLQPERKKRKYERKIKPDQLETVKESPPSDERRGGLILRLPRLSIKGDYTKEERPETPPTPPLQQPVSRPESRLESVLPSTSTGRKVNWMDILPSMDELRKRAAEKEAKRAALLEDHNKVYMLHINGEDVVALPYLEDPTVPDFITYKYPDPKQYYAEEDKPYANYE